MRVKNLIKRSDRSSLDSADIDKYSFGGNTIYFSSFQVENAGGEIKNVSKKEINLLKYLIENEGRVVSREEILDTVWGYDVYPTTRTIDNYILAFRKHFEKDSRQPLYFHSVRGVGYKFSNPKN